MEPSLRSGDWLGIQLRALSRRGSYGRGWSGFDAALIRVSGGASEPTLLARHNVTMLIGSPMHTTARCDEATANRLQQPGQFDVLPARSSVSWVDEGSGLFLAVGINHELVCQTAFEMGLEPDRLAIRPLLTCREPRVEHLLWALKAELESDDPHGRLYADSVGIALAAQLVRGYVPLLPERVSSGLPKRRLRRVLTYIDDRLACELSLADIAAAAGVSVSHFKFLFRQSVGMPVHRYVLQRRVECATDLITHTHTPLAEIALQAGFANQSHMARCLRRALGVTPKALRDKS